MNVAITFDDLPAHEYIPSNMTREDVARLIVATLKKHRIKHVYGFMNNPKINDQIDNTFILQLWVKQGQLLGNHTFSHLDLNKVDSLTFTADIEANEPILSALMEFKDYKYFRYPYLAEGSTPEKRDSIRKYLFDNEYQIAEVTTDFLDYEWNDPYVRCLELGDQEAINWLKKTYIEQATNALIISHELSLLLVGRDIENILLLHFGAFDALMLDELLTTYEKNNIHFIELSDALKDPIYQLDPNISTRRHYTFLNQIRLAMEVENPERVEQLYQNRPEAQLEQLCRQKKLAR